MLAGLLLSQGKLPGPDEQNGQFSSGSDVAAPSPVLASPEQPPQGAPPAHGDSSDQQQQPGQADQQLKQESASDQEPRMARQGGDQAWGTQYDDLLWLFSIQHRRVQQAASERLEKLMALKQQQQGPNQQADISSKNVEEEVEHLQGYEEGQRIKRARTEDCEPEECNA
jgi:hypothetical protein